MPDNEPIPFGDQFFWDFTNEAAADYFVSSVVASVAHPAVDGTFTGRSYEIDLDE